MMRTIRSFSNGIFLILLLTATIALAQPHGSPEEHAKMKTEHMKEMLDLTDEQATKVEAINLKYAKQMHEKMEAEEERTHDSRKKIMLEHMDQMQKELKEILNEDQQALLDEKIGEHREMIEKGHPMKHRRMGKEKKKAFRKELKAYMDREIMPVLKEQRKILDKELSDEDKAKIATAREEMEALRVKHMALRKEIRATKKEKTELAPELKEKKAAMKAEHKKLKESIKPLVESNEELIHARFEAMEAQRKTWRSEIHEIIEKHHEKDMDQDDAPEKPEEMEHHEHHKHHGHHPHHPHFEGHHPHRKGPHHGLHKMMKPLHSPAHFLLMDPEKGSWPEEIHMESPEMKVFPNPAQNTNKITFEVKEAGMVKIDLINKEGQLLKNVLNEQKEPGTYTITVNLSELEKNAVYFYQYSDNVGQATRKFILAE